MKTGKNGKEILLSFLKIGILKETLPRIEGGTAMSKSRGKILYILQAINIIPLFFLGILILLLGNHWITRSMYAEVESGLANISRNLATTLDVLYPGDYRLVGEDSYRLYKGETDLTTDYTLIDQIKEIPVWRSLSSIRTPASSPPSGTARAKGSSVPAQRSA